MRTRPVTTRLPCLCPCRRSRSGELDQSVDPAAVERWAADRPLVDLRLVDDDHQLTASMDVIWEESRKLLALE